MLQDSSIPPPIFPPSMLGAHRREDCKAPLLRVDSALPSEDRHTRLASTESLLEEHVTAQSQRTDGSSRTDDSSQQTQPVQRSADSGTPGGSKSVPFAATGSQPQVYRQKGPPICWWAEESLRNKVFWWSAMSVRSISTFIFLSKALDTSAPAALSPQQLAQLSRFVYSFFENRGDSFAPISTDFQSIAWVDWHLFQIRLWTHRLG